VVTDYAGDIYVASFGKDSAEGKEGRIDIFNAVGLFLDEIPDANGLKNMAVDTNGNLYVFEFHPGFRRLVRFHPTKYVPASSEINYEKTPTAVVVEGLPLSDLTGIAISPVTNHLFVHYEGHISEFGSAEESNLLLDSSIGAATLSTSAIGLAVDATQGRIYASDHRASPSAQVIRVFELKPPHALLMTVDGSNTPEGKFLEDKTTVSVDETTGHFFIYDGGGANVVYEFDEAGALVSTIEHNIQSVFGSEIGIDNGPTSPNMGTLFVPSGPSTGHSFAFSPTNECEAEVLSASVAEITESDAHLQAEVNPCNLATSYSFQYTTKKAFEAEGFASATVAGGGSLPIGRTPVLVTAAVGGLSPETAYRFRVIASNTLGGEEAAGEFATFPATVSTPPCPNLASRTGASALLPDCRAYELVTPPDTNARTPSGLGHLGVYFTTREASPTGDKVSFLTEGGSIPSKAGTGSLGGDPYLATRGSTGWVTTTAGPNGIETEGLLPGSTSPDQGYSFWSTSGGGSAVIEGQTTNYVRYPDGHSALVGRGSLGTDPRAQGKLISENGRHIIFTSGSNLDQPVQLEPNAPPDGTRTIYDRTPDEVTHVVSLLPGNVTPADGENASYVGSSLDGKGVAFLIGKKLYLRFDEEDTYEIGEGINFAGISEGGTRIFYLEGGGLFAFDAEAEETIRFTESGDITPVNVAAEGTAAYFISPGVLTGEEENPNKAKAQAGKENLYLSREGAISFVATVTKRDVEGESGNEQLDGLGLWTEAVGPGTAELPGRLAADPSRSTPDGNAMLFESRAVLAGYDPEGHAEVYRYDSSGEELECLSCNPTLTLATSNASLQSISEERGNLAPFSSFALADNLRADGRRAFFQSSEPLVQNDTDGLQDVYEWEAQGVGSCERPGGCIELISSGHSSRNDYLYGVSDSGNDAFFRSSDLLLHTDADETPSIYDARVGGGFPEPPGKPCEDESCPEALPSPPVLPLPTTGPIEPPKNFKQCPKGKRQVTHNGKTHCVPRHRNHHHRRVSSKRKGAGK
jgi:hypothetical protein